MNNRITAAVFFGSLWGMVEALLGGFMHSVLPFFPYTGAIVVSLAMPFILGASKAGRGTVMLSGAVAASFKLINFFVFPSVSVVRPMVAILGEAALIELLLYALPNARGFILGLGAATGSLAGMLLPPVRIDVGIVLSIAITALLCELTTRIKMEKIRPGARSASALFLATAVITFLL